MFGQAWTFGTASLLSRLLLSTRNLRGQFLLKKFASLYYDEDLDGPIMRVRCVLIRMALRLLRTDPKFAIGPSTGRELFDDGRAAIEFDTGLCKTYQCSVGRMHS